MKKRYVVIIIVIAIIVLLLLALGGCYYFTKGMAFYKPEELAEKGEEYFKVPGQEGAEKGFWKTEEGIDLYYFTQGEGENPVVIVHGGPGAPPSEKWDALDGLGDDNKFYYYHQRGSGKSTRPITSFD